MSKVLAAYFSASGAARKAAAGIAKAELAGVFCGRRPSCAGQLAKAARAVYEAEEPV